MDDAPTLACPSCGAPNPASFRFCAACGSALTPSCPACGTTAARDARFCGNCGASLAADDGQGDSQSVVVEERKLVSVVFADLESSTQLATSLDPEDLREVYAAYFEEMSRQIVAHGGIVEKFIGDAVVGVFGVPLAHDDDAVRAVRAALAMQRGVPFVNTKIGDKAGAGLEVRIGVHTGEVLASPAAAHESAVTGETTTIAARLQAMAQPGSILVSQRTERASRRSFEYEPVGDLALKGISGAVGAFRPVGEKAWRAAGEASPLVGRRDELDLLTVLLRRCVRERRPYVVTVVAPPGIGKTRLAAEFTRSVSASVPDSKVVIGRCPAYGEGLRFWPLAEILKEDARILDSDAPAVMLEKTRDSIGRRFDDQATAELTTSALLSSLGVVVDPDPLAGAGRAGADRLISEAWSRYLTTLAGSGALVAVIEDIHWADPGLLDLLERLASAVVAPVLVICSARPELHDKRPTWGAGRANFATIELSPLSPEEERDLLANLLQPAAIDERVLDALVGRTEGNPFFATELLRMLQDSATIELQEGRWMLRGDLPSELPDSVQATIAARLDRLGVDEKRAIQDAAVVGRIFWDGVLERLGSDERALHGLVERKLIRTHAASTIAGALEYAFDHALIRDVAYSSIPRARRRQAHAVVADWMETVTPGRDEEFAELLAHHAILAGDPDRTAHYAGLAGHRYRRIYAAEEALRWYDRALAPATEIGAQTKRLLVPEILHSRGETYEQLGRLELAAADYEAEFEIAQASGRPYLSAFALASLAHVLWLNDDYARAKSLLPAGLEAARLAGTTDLEVRLQFIAGSIAWATGDWQSAFDHHGQAMALAVAAGDLEGEAYARQGIADTLSFKGPLSEALAEGLAARALWERLGDRPRIYRSAQRVAFVYALIGRFDAAAQCVDETLQGQHELGQRRDEAITLAAQGLVYMFRGSFGAALAALDQAIEIGVHQSARRSELIGRALRLMYAAEVGTELDRWHDVAAARALSERLAGFLRPVVTAADGVRLAQTGDFAAARRRFTEAREEAADAIFSSILVARMEICTWEQTGSADWLLEAGQWLAARVGDESPPHAALARYAELRACARMGQPIPDADDLLAMAKASGNATVAWRAEFLAEDKPAHEIFSTVVASIEDEAVRRDFLARAAWLDRRSAQSD
jgi:class 3 adenylate cyclase/tetratricopeptide (TPR) repeat protein